MKNNFYNEIKAINKKFDKQIKQLTIQMEADKKLVPYSNIFNTEFCSHLTLFTNSIMFYLSEKNNEINLNDNVYYQNVLKSIILLSLQTQNEYYKNIFYQSFNLNEFDNNIDLNSLNNCEINKYKNMIYNLSFYVNKIIHGIINIQDLYLIFANFIICRLINDSENQYKYFLFIKIKLRNKKYQIQKTENYLYAFIKLQTILKKYFPIKFNNLTYIINKF